MQQLEVNGRVIDAIVVPDDAEYIAEVQDILENKSFQSMRDFIQHGTTSCLSHSISVSYRSYLTCKRYGLNARAAARAGLLHDLFLYDWHLHRTKVGERLHGFSHPQKALNNAEKEFALLEIERDIILKHMWPLTIVPPKSKEAFIVSMYDKMCSLREIFNRPDPLFLRTV